MKTQYYVPSAVFEKRKIASDDSLGPKLSLVSSSLQVSMYGLGEWSLMTTPQKYMYNPKIYGIQNKSKFISINISRTDSEVL
jgi:hypothetical protein